MPELIAVIGIGVILWWCRKP